MIPVKSKRLCVGHFY